MHAAEDENDNQQDGEVPDDISFQGPLDQEGELEAEGPVLVTGTGYKPKRRILGKCGRVKKMGRAAARQRPPTGRNFKILRGESSFSGELLGGAP